VRAAPRALLLLGLVGLAGVATGLGLGFFGRSTTPRFPKGEPAVSRTLHDFEVERIDGTPASLAEWKGKAVLVVNTASECGLTPQYEGLEALHARFRDRGFAVLAFPANDFGAQEPGSNAEIAQFCSTRFQTTFPLYAKIHVKGEEIAPLYAWLTGESGFPGEVKWNFGKFLVGPDGRVLARFEPGVEPLDPGLVAQVEAALPPD
jgi:glutathione peroxidase